MASSHLLRGLGASAVTRRGQGTLDRLWDRIQARAQRAQTQAVEEREEAKALLAELMALPDAGERRETVEREPRFWVLGLVEHVLEIAGTPEVTEAAGALALAELALALVRRLEPQSYAESLIVEQEVVAWSLWAEAHRRRRGFARAESGFRAAARRLALEPLSTPERAVFSRYLARLRQDQGWDDEALSLLQRAADLFQEAGDPAAAGEVLSERGWLCLEAGDPASAHPSLEHAVALLQKAERPEAAMRAWQGLALAYAGLSLGEDARHALGAAQALDRTTPGSAEAARHLILEARVADRLGDAATTASLLASALSDLLAARAFYDAAIAALELAQLYAAQERTAEVEQLRAKVAPLREPGALPDRARPVLLFVLHRASLPGRDATELLAEAVEFLERARERPWLRFQMAGRPRTELSWDLLEPAQRRDLCARAGLAPETAALPAAELPATERDLLTWTYELLAGVRITFDPLPNLR